MDDKIGDILDLKTNHIMVFGEGNCQQKTILETWLPLYKQERLDLRNAQHLRCCFIHGDFFRGFHGLGIAPVTRKHAGIWNSKDIQSSELGDGLTLCLLQLSNT